MEFEAELEFRENFGVEVKWSLKVFPLSADLIMIDDEID